jgi:acyl carrier protein
MNNTLSEKDNEAVLDILVEQIGVQRTQLLPDAKIQADLGADSLTVIEIVLAVEERFKLSLPDERVENVVTVADLQELLADVVRERDNHVSC